MSRQKGDIMKEVMISIQPKWVEKICRGEKTVEVRKTRPKCDTPFKCYIYCTKDNTFAENTLRGFDDNGKAIYFKANKGKVIGEFVCNEIENLTERDLFEGMDEISNSRIENYSCVDIDELLRYKGSKNEIYGWHITDLVVYDEPRELSEFYSLCPKNKDCGGCAYYQATSVYTGVCVSGGYKPITRAPQSWKFCVATEPRQTAD